MIDDDYCGVPVRHSTYCCHCHSLFDKLMIEIKTWENEPISLHLLLSDCQRESLFNSAHVKASQSSPAWFVCMKEQHRQGTEIQDQHFYMLSLLWFFFSLLLFITLSSSCPPGHPPAPDQCPERLLLCPMELWQWPDQPAVQLEQPGSRPVTQTTEAAVWGATVSPLWGGWL